MKIATLFLAAGLAPLWPQEIRIPPGLEKLASQAEESVDVTMNKATLGMAARFLSPSDPDEARTRKLLSGLDSITVRSYEFAREHAYDPADVEAVRAQLRPPEWSRIVGVRSKDAGDGNVDLYLRNSPNGQLAGVVILSAEPLRLTLVQVVGTLDPAQLADLGGRFGIPRLELGGSVFGRKGVR